MKRGTEKARFRSACTTCAGSWSTSPSFALIVVINIHPIVYLVAIVAGGVHISWRGYKRRVERCYRI